ncbi:MAG: hypothetical protein E6Q97_09125 [Desulfurellales bacterium]|nr:MAG: hypothetical protein E6Q97_09125 [Desulfurellales bacterium]
MALILRHMTPEQFLARLRERYRNASGPMAVHIGERLLSFIAAGDITDVQCRIAFGNLTASQWNAIKTRINNRTTARNTVRGATGE